MSAEVAQAENVANVTQEKDLLTGVENTDKQPDVAAEGKKGDTSINEQDDPILASNTDEKVNEVDKPKEQENGAAEDKMDIDQKQAESHETTNGTGAKIEAPAAQDIPGSESATAKEDISSTVPESSAALEEKKEKEVPAPSHVDTNGTEEVAPAVQPPPPTSVLPSDDAAATGEKRKADEQASTEEPFEGAQPDENGEHDAKKPKVSEEAPEANGEESVPTEPVKRKPGRPPKSSNGTAKKEKKAPAVGRSERRTRSQGGV
ncbi:hypothetical protein F5884DRAFT_791387 [Xylogone sp. PMI_703]|nr:hypothetical protein F5884DRAFT_791387 [Xylogone sp. PMI_703]